MAVEGVWNRDVERAPRLGGETPGTAFGYRAP